MRAEPPGGIRDKWAVLGPVACRPGPFNTFARRWSQDDLEAGSRRIVHAGGARIGYARHCQPEVCSVVRAVGEPVR